MDISAYCRMGSEGKNNENFRKRKMDIYNFINIDAFDATTDLFGK